MMLLGRFEISLSCPIFHSGISESFKPEIAEWLKKPSAITTSVVAGKFSGKI